MSYIDLMNGFDRWLEGNYLPASSQLLWYRLVALCNRLGWAEWVQVDNLRLMAEIQTKREASFINARDKLIEAGLVEYQKGKKGFPNRYRICTSVFTFTSEVQNVVNTEVQSVVQSEVESVVQTADINRQDKDKKRKKKDISNDISKESAAKKQTYGEFGKVKLTRKEYDSLGEKLGNPGREAMIARLDGYIASKGDSYKSHYATILNWRRRDEEKAAPAQAAGELDEELAQWERRLVYGQEKEGETGGKG